MIISKDFRIENYLLKDGKIVEVAVINADNTIRVWNEEKTNTLGCFRLKDFDPIQLTEEWLLKFGFEKKNDVDFDKVKLRICMYDDRFPNGRVYFNSWAIIDENLKFVHQLQNLYFALTGEELTIC